MKYSNDQLILSAHVRTLAMQFLIKERNGLSDKWHADNPGKDRDMNDFAADIAKVKSFNAFILEAHKELESITSIILESKAEPGNLG